MEFLYKYGKWINTLMTLCSAASLFYSLANESNPFSIAFQGFCFGVTATCTAVAFFTPWAIKYARNNA